MADAISEAASGSSGTPLLLSGTSYTIVGILPPLLGNPYGNVQLIATRPNEFGGLTPQQVANGAGYLQTIARLKPGRQPRSGARLKSPCP
jgi:hypothetical protein